MIYQPSCQGVTIVSPSPAVGGTPCRIQNSVNLKIQEDSYPIQDSEIEELLHPIWHQHTMSPNILLPLMCLDRGANGGLAGADVCIFERTGRKVSVTGIDDDELPGLDIVTCVVLIKTNHGKFNMLMHEYAYDGNVRGNTIHSPCQIEWFNITCHDRPHHVAGKYVIIFLDGYAPSLQWRSGLMYMSSLGKPTDQDLDEYPHVHLTSPHEGDPSVLDYSHPNTHGYLCCAPVPSARDPHDPRIDECGNIHHRSIHTLSIFSETSTNLLNKHDQQSTNIDYNKLKPYFGWVNADTIKKTSENTT